MIKSKHRAISLILVVILAMSAFCASGISVFAASTNESLVSAGGNIVYLKNTKNWNSVYVYYWVDSSDNSGWPGKTMSLVEGTTDTYYYEIPEKYPNLLFNSGGNGDLQTGDLKVSDGSGKIYDPSTNQWSDYTGPVVPTGPTQATSQTDPTTTTPSGDNVVYCQNDAGWSKVYCYMWNSSDDENAKWPGVAMEDLGDGVWFYSIPKNYTNIIFNEGSDTNKTGDMTYPGTGRIYNNKTKEWDVFDTNPIRISGFTTDLASPQYKGMEIAITSKATSSGGAVSYKYTVTNTSTNETILLSNYGTADTVKWTPTTVGDYVITVEVIDVSGNHNQRTLNYSIADDSTLVKPIIKRVSTQYSGDQIQNNVPAIVSVSAGGGNTGTKLLFYKYIVTEPDGVQNTPYYSLSQTYQFTPTKLGEYKVQVYVQGSDNQTVNKTYTYTSVGEVVTTATAPTTSIVTNPSTSPSTDPTAPTTTNPTDPTGINPTDPTGINPTDPTGVNPTDPTGINPTDPTGIDPTAPTTINPTDPTGTYPTYPTTTNPTDPTGTNPTDPTNPEWMLGDVTLDRDLNIKDVTEIQLYLAHFRVFTELQKTLADYDCDGHINIKDATKIQFVLANLTYVEK